MSAYTLEAETAISIMRTLAKLTPTGLAQHARIDMLIEQAQAAQDPNSRIVAAARLFYKSLPNPTANPFLGNEFLRELIGAAGELIRQEAKEI